MHSRTSAAIVVAVALSALTGCASTPATSPASTSAMPATLDQAISATTASPGVAFTSSVELVGRNPESTDPKTVCTGTTSWTPATGQWSCAWTLAYATHMAGDGTPEQALAQSTTNIINDSKYIWKQYPADGPSWQQDEVETLQPGCPATSPAYCAGPAALLAYLDDIPFTVTTVDGGLHGVHTTNRDGVVTNSTVVITTDAQGRISHLLLTESWTSSERTDTAVTDLTISNYGEQPAPTPPSDVHTS